MPALALLLLLVPLVELWLIAGVSARVGLLPTIVALIAISIWGAMLLKREGVATWRRLKQTTARGELPTQELVDGVLILAGGALLLTPGFLTDAVGLLMVFPATRGFFKIWGKRVISWLTFRRFGVAGEVGRRVYDTRAKSRARRIVDQSPPDITRSSPPLSPPGSVRPPDAGGSPDRR